MIIVINLLRNIFIIMFFILMILEIIVLLALVLLYDLPLQNNINQVVKTSNENINDIITSFNYIYVRKFYNLATDLLLIAKHNYPMYLTLEIGNKSNVKYPMYNNESQFVKNYLKSCICNIGNNSCFSLPNNITNSSENDIINQIFNDDNFNKILFNKNISLDNKSNQYLCYSVSILKTIHTRNMIFDKTNSFVENFLLLTKNNSIYQYPVKKINFTETKIYSYPYQNGACNNDTDCFTTRTNIENKSKSFFNSSEIFFDSPIFFNKSYRNI